MVLLPFISCPWRSSSLLFILSLWIGFPQASSLYSLLDSLHHCCSFNFHFPQHKSQNYTFPNAQLLLNISCNLFYRYLKSRMSNIKFTTFPFQLILLHIFYTSVNGTHCSSTGCKMVFLLLIPKNGTRINSVYLLVLYITPHCLKPLFIENSLYFILTLEIILLGGRKWPVDFFSVHSFSAYLQGKSHC